MWFEASLGVKTSHSPRPTDLVPGNRDQVSEHTAQIQGHHTQCLDSIGVKDDFPLPRNLPDLIDRLEGADLVIGIHDTDENGIVSQCGLDVRGVHPAPSVNANAGHLKPQLLQPFERTQHRKVLYLRGDQVFSVFLPGQGRTDDGQIVRLGASAGENQVFRAAFETFGHGSGSRAQCFTGPPSERVNTGWVTKFLGQVWKHSLNDLGMHRAGRGVIEIDLGHGSVLLGPFEQASVGVDRHFCTPYYICDGRIIQASSPHS